MNRPEIVLAECLDVRLRGGDPAPILSQHPEVAGEVSSLLATAERVRESAAAFYVVPEKNRLRQRTEYEFSRRETILTLLRRVLTVNLVSR